MPDKKIKAKNMRNPQNHLVRIIASIVVLSVASWPSKAELPEPLATMEHEFAQVAKLLDAGRYDEAIPKLNDLARSGNPNAQFALAVAYFEGLGLERSNLQAFLWSWCAQANFEYWNYRYLERQAKNFAFFVLHENLGTYHSIDEVENWPWCENPFHTDEALLARISETRSCQECDLRGFFVPVGTDWSGADLRGSDLSYIDASATVLNAINLTEAELVRSDFAGAKMANAILVDANLDLAFFNRTDLTGADLSGAFLRLVMFHDADLTGADLTGAAIDDAYFCNTTMPDGSLNNTDCAPQ